MDHQENIEILKLRPEDLWRIKPLIEEMFQETTLPGRFNPVGWEKRISPTLASGLCLLAWKSGPVGFLLATRYVDPMTGERRALLSNAFVSPRHRSGARIGSKLVKDFEEWAQGDRLIADCLDPRIARWMQFQGYRPLSTVVTK